MEGNLILNRLSKVIVGVLIILMVLYYIPLPYYITEPGTVEPLEPLVKVEQGYDEEGSFSLVTVYMSKANVYGLVRAGLSDDVRTFKQEEILSPNETDEEYNLEQLRNMDSAKNGAIITAYQKAGKPVNINYKGIYVMAVVPDYPADGKLRVGDLIEQVDGEVLDQQDEFLNLLAEKKVGDSVKFAIERNQKEMEVSLELKLLPSNKPGIGISPMQDLDLSTDPKIEIDSEEIGGPSAGLMFSLEIYNQLTEADLTKGYKIAGTGTIDEAGKVGAIGGIEQKVVAASDADSKIFFAPVDGDNYQDAVKKAEKIKTKMIIVPVETFDDAVEYLNQMD